MKYRDIQKELLKYDPFVIGNSVFGQEIYGYHVGKFDGKQIFLSGGIHSREYISTLFLMQMLDYLKSEEKGIYIVPLLNPDGVKIALDGIDWLDQKNQENLLKINKSMDFSLWKANGRGVDLNVNFDAKWGTGKYNLRTPSSSNFIGYFPNSEPENQAVIKFLTDIQPEISLSFHSKGEVMYYGFEKYREELERDKKIAKSLAKCNGYKIIKTRNSAGGLSDWINLKLKKSAFTIELGNDRLHHPITEHFLPDIFEKNKDLPTRGLPNEKCRM